MPDGLNCATFQGLLNTEFTAETDGSQSLTLELVEVVVRDHDPKLEAFSLFFRGTEDPYLKQNLYTFAHEKLGKVPLFITPLGPKDGHMSYEAVFNRIRKENK